MASWLVGGRSFSMPDTMGTAAVICFAADRLFCCFGSCLTRFCWGSAARASAIDGCMVASSGNAGAAEEDAFEPAICNGFPASPRKYQQWRLVTRSIR